MEAYILLNRDIYCKHLYTVEPLIKDTHYKGHNRIYLHSKDNFHGRFVCLQYICNL